MQHELIPFAREVSEDPGSQMIDFIVVNRAAEVLWAASPGSPHWRDLDVEAFLAALERHNMPSWLPRDNAIYHSSYSLGGLLNELETVAARGGSAGDRG